MRKFIKHPSTHEPCNREKRPRLPLICIVFMLIGILTVLYFLITYGLIPLLAMMTTA